MRHIIGILLQNESGALNRVAGLFTNRGFNIESLSVSATDDPTVSRITLVTTGSDATVQQIVSQLNKLVDVVGVQDMTGGAHIERELVLVRLRPRNREQVLSAVQAAGGRVLTTHGDTLNIEVTGVESGLDALLQDLRQHAVLDAVVRSGTLGLPG
jgi:acetolactate synthase-1/3 small subunit